VKKRERTFFDWLVETLKPGFHVARNPPKTGKGSRTKAAETCPPEKYPTTEE